MSVWSAPIPSFGQIQQPKETPANTWILSANFMCPKELFGDEVGGSIVIFFLPYITQLAGRSTMNG